MKEWTLKKKLEFLDVAEAAVIECRKNDDWSFICCIAKEKEYIGKSNIDEFGIRRNGRNGYLT